MATPKSPEKLGLGPERGKEKILNLGKNSGGVVIKGMQGCRSAAKKERCRAGLKILLESD